MALKERWRRAMGHSERSSSSNSSTDSQQAATPVPSHPSHITPVTSSTATTPPALTLTKTTSRLGKTLTWRSTKSKKAKDDQSDGDGMLTPKGKHNRHISVKHQEILHAFEWKFGRKSMDRSGSMYSGVSPGTSRNVSVDEGALHKVLSGKGSSHIGPSRLSHDVGAGEEADPARAVSGSSS